jgi:hypothetical protein
MQPKPVIGICNKGKCQGRLTANGIRCIQTVGVMPGRGEGDLLATGPKRGTD